MGKARQLADLLNSDGDVKSSALDNVPASNNASALTTGTLPIARIANGAVTNAHLATGISSSKLTGALPAIDGSSLTGVAGVPSGVIAMWSGSASAIPSGWVICDGANSTPNLVGKFIKGGSSAGSTGGSGTTSSSGAHTHTGASHTHSTPNHSHSHTLIAGSHTLTTSQMPSHNHSIPHGRSNFGQYNSRTGRGGSYDMTTGYTNSTGSSSPHEHNMSGSISAGGASTTGAGGTGATSSNGAHTHTLEPTYYTLCFVMKT